MATKGRYEWLLVDFGLSIASGAQFLVTIDPGASFLPGTIIRMLLWHKVFLTVAVGVESPNAMDMGVGVVNLRATAATTPRPFVEVAYPWLWMNSAMPSKGGGDDAAVASQQAVKESFDIRTKRKIDNQQELAIMCDNQSAVALTVHFFLRALIYTK